MLVDGKWTLVRMFLDFLLIISGYRASISELLTLKSFLMLNVKDSWRNTAIPPPLPVFLTWWMLLYCGSSKKLWFIELSEHQVSVIHITLNSTLSVINRLRRLLKFFCKLLMFRCSIEKLLLSKLFKFREDPSGAKYCESLKLNALKKFSSGSWLSLSSIFSKSNVLNAADSKSAFLVLVFIGEPMP